ncbi:hypothetical protein B484DRAFT_430359 [Ochromonadaceae sp. CCMP2298]|nr:hypothetical protein B484DRAFT_430359 [Ochromonadaceae sp. CCMP2298]
MSDPDDIKASWAEKAKEMKFPDTIPSPGDRARYPSKEALALMAHSVFDNQDTTPSWARSMGVEQIVEFTEKYINNKYATEAMDEYYRCFVPDMNMTICKNPEKTTTHCSP